MSKVLHLALIFFACCFVVGMAFFLNNRSKKVDQMKVSDNNARAEVVFRNTAIVDGKRDDGTRFVASYYKSSDCIAISHRTIYFNTPTSAQEEIEREIEGSSRTIERIPLINNEGRQVGDRVVVQFEASAEHKAHAKVLWRKNTDFHSISAVSLEHVLEFEEALNSQEEKISSRIDNVQKVTFTLLGAREGKTDDGFSYFEKQFRSSDCETLTVSTAYFPSPTRAEEEMLEKLKGSTNIIEHGLKLNAAGQPVGKRALAMFRAWPLSEHIEDTVVLWTDNSELHSIKGSFTHVLELEKRNYSYE